MPQDPTELATDLSNLIHEAQAAGVPDEDIARVLQNALDQLETDDDDADNAE